MGCDPGPRRARALMDIPEVVWRTACDREAVVRPLAEAPRLTAAVLAAACARLRLGKSQVYALVRQYRRDPRTTSLVPASGGMPKGADRLSPAVGAVIERCIEQFYLTRQKLTGAGLYRAVRHECHQDGLRVPSLHAVRRRVAARPVAQVVRAREGAAAAAQRYRPVPGSLHTDWPLDIVQIDHTPIDLIVVDEAARRPIGRPWLTLALDVDTRMVAGFVVSLDPPSAVSAALAVAHAVLPKEAWLARRGLQLPWPVVGLPRIVHVDNAKEFHGHALERGCRQHGIQIEFRPVRTPRYGGHIERLTGTLMQRVHELPGTTFSNVRERGASNPEAGATLTLNELELALALEVLGPYHLDVHSALGVSPLVAWSERLPKRPRPPRMPADATEFFRDFLPFKEVTVRREGIRLHSIFYYDDVLTTWLGAASRRLRAKYDPRDLSTVFLEDEAGRYWPIRYRDLARPAITLWEQRAAVAELRAHGRGLVDEAAIFAAVAARRELVAAAARRTKAARRDFERTRHLRGAAPVATVIPAAPPNEADADEAAVPMPTAADWGSVEEWS